MIRILSLRCEDYPIKVMLAEHQRIKYYRCNVDKVLVKHLNKDKTGLGEGYSWENGQKFSKGSSVLMFNNVPVARNAKQVGEAKYININGQLLHQLRILPAIKAKIVNALKIYFLERLAIVNKPELNDNEYPLFIEYIFYSKEEMKSDLDNHALFYHKVFTDVIQHKIFTGQGERSVNTLGIIPDDTVKYLNGYSVIYQHEPEMLVDRVLRINILKPNLHKLSL